MFNSDSLSPSSRPLVFVVVLSMFLFYAYLYVSFS